MTQPPRPGADPPYHSSRLLIDDEPVSDEERRRHFAEAKKLGRFVTTAALKERLAERSKQH